MPQFEDTHYLTSSADRQERCGSNDMGSLNHEISFGPIKQLSSNESPCETEGSYDSLRVRDPVKKRDSKRGRKLQTFSKKDLEQEIENVVGMDRKVQELETELDALKKKNLNKKDL